MSVQDYIAVFEDLTRHNNVRELCSETITKFVWGLRSKIKHAMITGSYNLDTVEEVFDVAFKINLIFKTLVNAKAWCSKCKGVWIL